MICEACEGEGYIRGNDLFNQGALVMLPCLECAATGIPREEVIARAYADETYPARVCDHCSKIYHGPAVYCSLECAIADA